jgi:hypothetical protein
MAINSQYMTNYSNCKEDQSCLNALVANAAYSDLFSEFGTPTNIGSPKTNLVVQAVTYGVYTSLSFAQCKY